MYFIAFFSVVIVVVAVIIIVVVAAVVVVNSFYNCKAVLKEFATRLELFYHTV
jgi:hypothetical protein